ncbi:CPBP family intramembrane metalloprotease [Flaviaesturariibacter flavus]|uniref:CPBP family intramembrane metalloprotease n=1 Tax=Flaviaesturariibacter flavus TaxID=2502780 RepID=A0A4R1BAM5_9BACT|nr:type II CAAX endopeptidase family protein [Flaviaesturariibacter flavus]TCJ13968.1 CPBP family intramembrane metalloprotease [Flaviaesturariibacter flavus]
MQTYLKSRPALVQLLLFLGIACSSLLIISGLGGILLSAITGIPLRDMGIYNGAKGTPAMIWNLRGLVVLQDFGLFLIPSLVYAKFADAHPARYLGMRLPKHASMWILGIAVLLVAVPLVEFTGLLNQRASFPDSVARSIREMEESAKRMQLLMLADRSIGNLLINILLIGVLAGLSEELFFRGVVQRILVRAFRSPWPGIVVTAALFSFFHFEFYGFVPRLILGILLGAAYWYSGSIWVAVVAHALFNSIQLVAAWFHPELAGGETITDMSALKLLPAAVISAGLTAWVVLRMKRSSDTSYQEVYGAEADPYSETNELR